MKVIGVGVDIVDNDRISKSIKNKLFLKRIYTNQEILFEAPIPEDIRLAIDFLRSSKND